MVLGCASLHTNWCCGVVLCLVVIWGLVGALVGVYCLFGGRIWMTLTQDFSACWKWGACFTKESDRRCLACSDKFPSNSEDLE